MKSIKYLFLIILTFSNCKNSSNTVPAFDNPLRISVNKESIISNGIASDYLTLSKIVPLQTSNACMISSQHQISLHKDRIFCMDKSQETLFVFNVEGKFLFKIGRTADIPQDFVFIGNFFLDKYGEKIFINDAGKKLIYQYSYDGFLEETIKMKWVAGLFGVVPGGDFAITYVNQKKSIYLTNQRGKHLQSYIPFYSEYHLSSKICPFYQFDKQLYFWQDLNDTIYRMDEKGCRPDLFVDFGTNKITRDNYQIDLKENKTNNGRPQPNYMYNLNYYMEGSDYKIVKFLYEFNYRPAYYQLIYNKGNSQSLIFSPGIRNDMLNLDYFPKFYDIGEYGFVSYVSANNLIYACVNENGKIRDGINVSNKVQGIVDSLKVTDNIVLVFYKLKNK